MSEHKVNFASCSSFQNALQAEKLMNIFNTLLNDHPVLVQNVRSSVFNNFPIKIVKVPPNINIFNQN